MFVTNFRPSRKVDIDKEYLNIHTSHKFFRKMIIFNFFLGAVFEFVNARCFTLDLRNIHSHFATEL